MAATDDRPSTPVLLGLSAIVLFSGTATATRAASLGFGGMPAGCGRMLLGGLLASAMLAVARPGWPSLARWRALVPVILGCGIGFPLLLSVALEHTDASHASVVIGLVPLLTMALSGERLPLRVLAATAVATAVVVGDAWLASGGGWTLADGLLGAAVLLAAWGYVGGARLARTMPGWQVICWGVAAPLPLTLVWSAVIAWSQPDVGGRLLAAPSAAWLGLLWVGLISQVLGFLPWYAALARGGIARVGRLQLAQPGLSVVVAWLLLHEQPRPGALLALAVVVGCLLIGRSRPSAQPAAAAAALPRETALPRPA